jgi:hypothetical protein
MRAIPGGLLGLSLLIVTAGAGRGDDADTIKALLDKGIKVLGGEDKLTKLQGANLSGKGVFHIDGKKETFTARWLLQGSDKYRSEITEDKGAKRSEIRVVNGDKGWVKRGNDEARALSGDELTEDREVLWFSYVTSVIPLKGKDIKLSLLGEAKVEGKTAVGVKVATKGHRDVKLYFDKESGLLLKGERQVKDVDRNKEFTEEVVFDDYKEVNGIKMAMKYITRWDGKLQAEVEMNEAKAEEKLDDVHFAKP